MDLLRVTILVAVLAAAAFGEELPPESTIQAPFKMNSKGRERLAENQAILEEHINITTANINVAKKNLNKLKQEIQEVSSLQQSHRDLASRYSAFVKSTEDIARKNKSALLRLEQWKKAAEVAGEDKDKIEKSLNEALAEEKERQAWAELAEQRLSEVRSVQAQSSADVEKLKVRMSEVEKEKQLWEERLSQYQEELKLLEAKLQKYETVREGQERLSGSEG